MRPDVDELLARRTRLLFWAVSFVVALFVGRLHFLQVVAGERLRDDSQSNSVKLRSLDAPRGLIWDSRGRLLVGNRHSHDLVLDREQPHDVAAVATWASRVTAETPEALEIRISEEAERGARTLTLADDLAFSQVAWVEARREDMPAVRVETKILREHPHEELAAHLLGYVGEIDAEELKRPELAAYHRPRDLVGKQGVERRYDELLTGERGRREVTVDNLGREIRSTIVDPPIPGTDVHLTIDLAVQRAAERALEGYRGALVMLDVRDGSVIAIASAPSFEPNAFAGGISRVRWAQYREDRLDPLQFRAIAGTYPPGSTFKVLVAAAALESGARVPSHRTTCLGKVRVHGPPRHCWKEEGHGAMDLERALVHSCNVYFYLTGRDTGLRAIRGLGQEIGFGERTGIDLPGERRGILPGNSWKKQHVGEPWYPGDTVNLAIGQGFLSVTPLQVAQLAAAVAGDGEVHRPHVFSHAVDPRSGAVVERHRPWLVRRAALSERTLGFLRASMEETVRGGTARRAAVPGLRVAGKTGTAQPATGKAPEGVPREERAERFQEHAWFMGFAPADAPEVAFAVVIEHAGKHGGEVAAPVAARALEAWASSRLMLGVAGQ